MLLRLAIDFEHPGRTWWEQGGQELWDSICEGMGENHVVLDEALARSWISQAEQVEGWAGGPDYAPHPVSVQTVDDDDDV